MQIDRRKILESSLAALAASALPAASSAIPPIARNGLAKFKFSLAAYSYRDLLTGDSPRLALSDFVADCAKMGLEGTELTSYYFPKEVTPAYLRQIKKQCFELGLDISGTAIGNDFGLRDFGKLKAQIAHTKRWIEYAELLGAPVIRIFAGHIENGARAEDSLRQMVEAMEECCDFAGQHGVFLALENHGGPTDTADGLLKFVQAVRSPWFGVNVDTGNFHSDDIYGEIARIAPYALNVQVKVVISGSDGRKQPSDYARLASILRDANYRGYIVLEYEEDGDPRVECPKFVDQLREAFVGGVH
ncbi:MAG: sugar phosphate isomerase/epimerase [Planctomycetes bacterium]|nr:sugar phosphate isomerase/epimerase [Planctomycetota bacterium]